MNRSFVLLTLAACAHPPAPAAPADCSKAPPVAAAEPAVPAALQTPKPAALDDAQMIANSMAFLATVDRYDSAAFQALVVPSFVSAGTGRTYALPGMVRGLALRADHKLPAVTRKCEDQRVLRGDAAIVYADYCEVTLAAHDDVPTLTHPVSDYIVWVPQGDTWKVAMLHVEPAGLEQEREAWNETFRSAVHFKTTANQHLIDSVKDRKPGKALDIAMGQGRNVLYLASKGWKVTGVDISDEGIKVAQANAAKQKLKFEAVNEDIDKYDLGKDKWDLVTLIYAGTDHKLIERVKPSIKKGGLFVVEFFAKESTKGTGIGGFEAGELAKLFDGWKIIKDESVEDTADWGLAKTKVARFTAQKL